MAAGDLLRRIYLSISELFPAALVTRAEGLFEQAGIPRQAARLYLGFGMFLSAAFGITVFFLSPIFVQLDPTLHVLLGIGGALLALAFLYTYLTMRAESRAEQIENVLPDALQIISSNIRAGMTLENAFWSTARSEFGPLRDEIKKVSAQTMGGRPFRNALLDMQQRVRSRILERSIRLIVEGIALGGEMAHLLEEVGKDIRNTQMLKKEIQTQTLMYAMFILFASVIVSPLLFSVAVYYSEVSERLEAKTMQAQKDVTSGTPGMNTQAIGFGSKKPNPERINASDIRLFSIGAIALTNFFSALLISGIRTGKRTRGLKYVLIFVLVALGIFGLAYYGLSSALGGVGR